MSGDPAPPRSQSLAGGPRERPPLLFQGWGAGDLGWGEAGPQRISPGGTGGPVGRGTVESGNCSHGSNQTWELELRQPLDLEGPLLRPPDQGMGLQRRGAPKGCGQILTGSPLGPCSPLKPAIPGSPLGGERGGFSHGVLSTDSAPTSRHP